MKENKDELVVMEYTEKYMRYNFKLPEEEKLYYINKVAQFYCRMQEEDDYVISAETGVTEDDTPTVTFNTVNGVFRFDYPSSIIGSMVAILTNDEDESLYLYPLEMDFARNMMQVAYLKLKEKDSCKDFIEFMESHLTKDELKPNFSWMAKMKYFLIECKDEPMLAYERIYHPEDKEG